MTTFSDERATSGKLSLAEILETFAGGGELPLKFSAYDGSSAGPDDAELGLDLLTPRGTTYLATAPGDLGLARAYVSGDLDVHGVHPGDPYELLKALDAMADRLAQNDTQRIVRALEVIEQTGKSLAAVFAMPTGEMIVRVLCHHAKNGRVLRDVQQLADGCILRASLPSDVFALEGDRIVTASRQLQPTRVEAHTDIPGQMFDWGKSGRCLETLLGELGAAAAA